MNESTQDEYEEVESPFASNKSQRSSDRPRLRTRKNVFNRPFAADSTQAPTYFETTSTRKIIGTADNTELIERQEGSSLHKTPISYLENGEEENEEETESLPARKSQSSPKKKEKVRKNLLAKAGWAVVGVLVLRLVAMDRGVWDYFSTESEINKKRSELKSIQLENQDLKAEISRIQLDRNYQKQLAKEHLGVIAADEFLILFAGEASDETDPNPVNSL
jgi:cell division protein FtsB